MPRFNGVVQALKYYVKDAKSMRWQNLKSALSQAPFFLSAVGHFFIKNMSMFYLNLKIESAEARSDCVELFTVSNKASITVLFRRPEEKPQIINVAKQSRFTCTTHYSALVCPF